MSLSDIRIVVVFCLVVGFVAMISAVFGIRGTYFILSISAIVNALFVVFSLIANGKL